MSGICGIVHCSGQPATAAELAPVLARLERRGPEGSHLALAGPAALGHTLLATTPEALHERLPLTHAETGCVITADLRLDNRDTLLAALFPGARGRIIGDGELVLAAYLKWGLACPEQLEGDFAFALWDPRCRRLLCARDRAAMRPLVYHHAPGRHLAFASEAMALLCHPAVPFALDEGRISDALENRESYDLTSTFFTGLMRLPPAHALVCEGGALRLWRYWQADPPTRLRLGSDAAYAEALLEVFTQAVRDRLRAPGPVGAMLSGGMDSGSIVAVAARLLKGAGAPPLATFSAVSADPACVETRAIRAAQTMPHIDPVSISAGELDDYRDDVARQIREMGEPFDAMPWNRAIYLAARRRGLTVVLDGACGDLTLASDEMTAWHLRRGRLMQAWREARGEEAFWGPEHPALRTFSWGLRAVIVPQALRDWRRRLTAARARRSRERASLLAPDFARRIDHHRRHDTYARHVFVRTDGRCEDRRALALHPFAFNARDRYDRVAAASGIEPRDPFTDRRLIEFALSLPPEQLQHNGWPKIILRRAMAGLLPDAVRWRVGKQHVGGAFADALIGSGLLDPPPGALARLRPFVKESYLGDTRATTGLDPPLEENPPLRYLVTWLAWIEQQLHEWSVR